MEHARALEQTIRDQGVQVGVKLEVLVLAVIAADAGESACQIAAVQELVDHLRDDRAQEPIAGLATFLVTGETYALPPVSITRREAIRAT